MDGVIAEILVVGAGGLDRRRHGRDPAQHHLRARAGDAEGAAHRQRPAVPGRAEEPGGVGSVSSHCRVCQDAVSWGYYEGAGTTARDIKYTPICRYCCEWSRAPVCRIRICEFDLCSRLTSLVSCALCVGSSMLRSFTGTEIIGDPRAARSNSGVCRVSNCRATPMHIGRSRLIQSRRRLSGQPFGIPAMTNMRRSRSLGSRVLHVSSYRSR